MSVPTADDLVCACCGERLRAETVVARGLDLCRPCLSPRGEAPRLGRGLPRTEPASLYLLQTGALVGAASGGAVLGAGLSLVLGANPANGAALFAVLGVLVFAFRLGRFDAWIKILWKRDVVRRLGLAHLPLDRFLFALRMRSDEPGDGWPAEDMGLALDVEDSIVYLGPDGLSVTPLATVFAMWRTGGRGSWWVGLDLVDGNVLYLSIQEGSTAWGASAATDAFGRRVVGRLGRPEVVVAMCEALIRARSRLLVGLTPAALPERMGAMATIGRAFYPPSCALPAEDLAGVGRLCVSVALVRALLRGGWAVSSVRETPRPLPLVARGGVELDPYQLVERLASGALPAEEWRRTWSDAGVADVDLGATDAEES